MINVYASSWWGSTTVGTAVTDDTGYTPTFGASYTNYAVVEFQSPAGGQLNDSMVRPRPFEIPALLRLGCPAWNDY